MPVPKAIKEDAETMVKLLLFCITLSHRNYVLKKKKIVRNHSESTDSRKALSEYDIIIILVIEF